MSGPVVVIGLGAMGLPMARSLLRAGRKVHGVDPRPAARQAFLEAGGCSYADAHAAAVGAESVLLVVVTIEQAEDVLFGAAPLVEALSHGTPILLALTAAPDEVATLADRLNAHGLSLIDCPVSGGVKRAATGTLTVLAAGPEEALNGAMPVMSALGRPIVIGSRQGQASAVKLLNQALCGIHLAAAAEVVALSQRIGVDPELAYEAIAASSGASHMFVDRAPKMIRRDKTVSAAVSILDKDLQLALVMGKTSGARLELLETAATLFREAMERGLAGEPDSSIVDLYSKAT